MTGYYSLNQQKRLLGLDGKNLQVFYGDIFIPHMTRHFHALENPGRITS